MTLYTIGLDIKKKDIGIWYMDSLIFSKLPLPKHILLKIIEDHEKEEKEEKEESKTDLKVNLPIKKDVKIILEDE